MSHVQGRLGDLLLHRKQVERPSGRRQLWWKRLIGDEGLKSAAVRRKCLAGGASRRFSTWQGQLDVGRLKSGARKRARSRTSG